jgi:hypothetical protein
MGSCGEARAEERKRADVCLILLWFVCSGEWRGIWEAIGGRG